MLLKDSKHKGQASWGLVEEVVHANLGDDPFGYRAELLKLATRAKALAGRESD